MVFFIWIFIVATGAFAEEKPGKAWADEGEVSFVNTSGNTQVTSSRKNQLNIKSPISF
jgi:hypothetical protein